MPKRILLDTDPGIDDACAILLALASPEVSLEGLSTVHGNCSLEKATRNALSLLELAHASRIPVVRGCELPLVQQPLLAPETHGDSGLGYARLPDPSLLPLEQHAVDFLIERILASPGEITLVALGPLTNIALAMRQEPRIISSLKELIIMGGAIRSEGNTTALAEFNTCVDPHAAHIVYHAGIPATLVPLDVTYHCILTPGDVKRLERIDSPITRFVAEATRFYMEFHNEYQQIEGCVINDPLALALAFMPELCTYKELPVDVDLSEGISMGKTVADFYNYGKKSANLRVALEVRERDFIDLFLERIENLARSSKP
ncbi:MAG TPA: nucleoside hydrolase [Anaerolineales bacterium]|nr:nucleoside hydrolase [Anaerolineales bacterium]